jgi:hypothetical protein
MRLAYADADETVIVATLDEGETLGNLVGPVVAHVPTDPANVDYADILAQRLPIDPYVAPAPLASVAIASSAQSLALSNAKSLAAQGRTDEALAALINLMEQAT